MATTTYKFKEIGNHYFQILKRENNGKLSYQVTQFDLRSPGAASEVMYETDDLNEAELCLKEIVYGYELGLKNGFWTRFKFWGRAKIA